MKKFWDFKKKDKVGELYLYGEISQSTWWGDEITPKQFKADLDALGDVDTLNVYINSPGGDVFAGWSIINILQRHKAQTVGYNDGLAASVAFDIFQSMDKRVAMQNSMFMTHNCWAIVMGNRFDLRKMADEMEKIDGMMAEMVAKKSGKTAEEVTAIQDAETWYSATEAVNEGFADELSEPKQIAACVTQTWMAKYKHPPEGLEKEEAPPEKEEAPQVAEQGGIFMPVKQGDEQPVSDTQKRRFAQTNRKFKMTEAQHDA